MSPMNKSTPPETFDPRYCEGVQALCSQRYTTLEKSVDDIHGAVFGSKEQPGMLQLLTKKLSIASVKWFLAVFALPAVLGVLAFYQFYISAPYKYADSATLGDIDNRVLRLEGAFNELPNAAAMKSIVKEAIRECQPPAKPRTTE